MSSNIRYVIATSSCANFRYDIRYYDPESDYEHINVPNRFTYADTKWGARRKARKYKEWVEAKERGRSIIEEGLI